MTILEHPIREIGVLLGFTRRFEKQPTKMVFGLEVTGAPEIRNPKNEGQAGIDLISKVSGNGKPTDIPLLATESIKELKKVNRLAGR
jgi:hypothetical protein